MHSKIIINDAPFIKNFIDIFSSLPSYYLVIKSKDIVGLKEYFENQLLELRNTYSTILDDIDSESLKSKISKLTYTQKQDLTSYFFIKSHLNSKINPGMKSFCKSLNLSTYSTKSLYEFLIGSMQIKSKKLEFNYTVHCPACKNYIPIIIKCKSNSSYESIKLSCHMCNHKFELVINEKTHCNFNVFNNCDCSYCTNTYTNMIYHIENTSSDFIKFILEKTKETEQINTSLSLEQKYKIHKNSLSKTETELLNLKPNSYEEVIILLDEMLSRYSTSINKSKIINNLIKHGILYTYIVEKKIISILDDILMEFDNFKEKLLENKWDNLRISSYNYYRENCSIIPLSVELCSWNDSCPFIRLPLDEIDITDSYELKLNPLYITNLLDKPSNTNKSYRIFGSNAELTLYNSLKRIYPNDFIIIPNLCLHSIANLSIIKNEFSDKDYLYLKTCRLDFFIADSNGYIVEVVELQKGTHHDTKEWIYKDSLKRTALTLLKIPLREEY